MIVEMMIVEMMMLMVIMSGLRDLKFSMRYEIIVEI
jgi:hypothetical protein